VARGHAYDRSGSWRSSARDASGVPRALTQLGKRIRTLRLERELTQKEAATTAKLDEKHWQDIEGARTNPTVATLVGIARALRVTLSALFEHDAKERSRTPSSPPKTAPATARPAPPRARASGSSAARRRSPSS
jgi:transcriptional regulator with XRE-family HTH domain